MAEPALIGRYVVEAVIGRGAMGVIYRAHDPAIDRRVAIKLVRTDLLEGDDRAEYILRFQREAQAAGRCAHPNIVAIYDYALHDGNPYLAMEYIDGVTLNQVTQRPGGFSAAEIVSLGGQMLDGLSTAHALGVIHRDIKPANVMLTAGGHVKVTDFGISRLDTSNLTGTGGVVGTPSYMSPEQCRGGVTDARSDLFSVAVVLYELVTGNKPFRGKSQHEVWQKLLSEEPEDSATIRPDLPGNVHAVIRRGLAKDAASRFASAADMAAGLRAGQASATEGLAAIVRDGDRTVMQGPQTLSQTGLMLDAATTSTIERGLARHVGPIAAYLVRSAVKNAVSVDALASALSASINDPVQRGQFMQELKLQLAGSVVQTMPPGGAAGTVAAPLPATELERAQAELARFVGPIARILVKRAAAGCSSTVQLWSRLAENVDAADRASFLKKQ